MVKIMTDTASMFTPVTGAELGIDDPSKATGWSYQLPSEDDDLNNTFKYVITYETTVDASGKITDFNVSNGIKDDEGHTGGGGGGDRRLRRGTACRGRLRRRPGGPGQVGVRRLGPDQEGGEAGGEARGEGGRRG